ncbi:MAG: aromatic amino acid lyase [Saprospiraceae bacterium]|nr:aromatic amino acid lyase [Saprospiraceae bacterium]
MEKISIGQGLVELKRFQEILTKQNAVVELDDNALEQVSKSYEFLKDFARDKVIYGVNTGFGPMAQFIISPDKGKELQYNLIRSHTTGMGTFLPPEYSKAVLVARLTTLMLGRSGIHPSVPVLISKLIEKEIFPCIPEHGSVGASGDLVQLAHVASCLIGEWKVWFKGEIRPTKEVFEKEGLAPIEVFQREGLALINGTSAMTGIGMVNLLKAQKLVKWSAMASAILNELFEAYDDHFSEPLNRAKLHEGQNKIAESIRGILSDSHLIRNRQGHLYAEKATEGVAKEKIQEYYSLRCIPQVLGPVLDTLNYAEKVLVGEMNSANDNPIVIEEDGNVYHGGNFHGDYVALEMDKMKIAITKLSMLAERQLNFLLNEKLNNKLPPFVNLGTLGLNFGMQGAQFTATSTVAENQTLSFPMYVHSIPNNNDNQDIVSMGTNAALLTKKVIENSFQVLAIEWVTILQAVDYLKIADKLSSVSREVFFDLRAIVPIFEQDSSLAESLQNVRDYLENCDKEYC